MKKIIIAVAAALVCLCACDRRDASYSWEKDLAYREAVQFTWTRDMVKDYIMKYIPDVTDEQIDNWTENGPLEWRIIDGEKLYFNRTAAGLFRVDPECKAIKEALGNKVTEKSLTGEVILSEGDESARAEILSIMAAVKEGDGTPYVCPSSLHIKYSITVDADAVPAGETIRCWLPFPRQDVGRQKDIRFIAASEDKYKFSKPSCAHSSLYMEKAAVAGEPTVFSEEFEITTCAEWNEITADMVKPYDKSSALYKENTSERETHIIFSDRMRFLADSLTAGIENPLDQTKAIFKWIREVYPWSGAMDYSIIPNIPEYVLDSGHGDCGQVTLLLMTLLRIKGIPCHWQSGLLASDGSWNLHDWCEVYFEGVGWVTVDQSAGYKWFCPDDASRYFYIGGCGNERITLNNDYGRELSPKKIYPRSETVDFQKGEVEWNGGNLYYDLWSAHMDVNKIN